MRLSANRHFRGHLAVSKGRPELPVHRNRTLKAEPVVDVIEDARRHGCYDPSRAVDEGRRRISMKPPAPLRPGHTMSISRLPHIEQTSRSRQIEEPNR
jgi:hypothetical protein